MSPASIRSSCGSSPICRTTRRPRDEVMEASADARQEVYGWLFKAAACTSRTRASASCSRRTPSTASCRTGGGRATRSAHLVPSYGTAIGSSGDRPDALADLMGIILNDGVAAAECRSAAPAFRRGHALRDRDDARARAATGPRPGGRRDRAAGADGRRRGRHRHAACAAPTTRRTEACCRSAARPAPATTASTASAAAAA